MSVNDWPAPGKGIWIRLADHFDRPWTAQYESIFKPAIRAGSARYTVPFGLPWTVVVETVHGYPYLHPVPIAGPDTTMSVPGWLLWAFSRSIPAYRRCEKAAEHALRERPWRAIAAKWFEEGRPAAIKVNRALTAVDVTALSDTELARHLEACDVVTREGYEMHFEFHGSDLLPLGLLLDACRGWGIDASVALDLVVEAAADVRRARLDPDDLAQCIVGGYDIDRPRLCELPDDVVSRIGGPELVPTLAARLDRVDDFVPTSHREEFDILLGDARAVFPLRDDNGVVLGAWRMGLLRRAYLEAGARLELPDVVEATVPELVALLEARAPVPPLSERAALRAKWAKVDAPLRLGKGTDPDLAMFPENMRRLIAVQLMLRDLIERDHTGDLEGLGVGENGVTGIARVVTDVDDAIMRLEPDDILVVRATSPAFNVVLPLAAAIVTEHGGAMSHAAIVARELGVPAIVGVKDATRHIRDGERIHVDPVAGRVVVVDAELAPKSVTP